MSTRIIHRLESVEVDVDQRERLTSAKQRRDSCLEHSLRPQPRQCVEARLLLNRPEPIFQLDALRLHSTERQVIARREPAERDQ